MEISSEEEDGEINKEEQLEERVRNTFDKSEPEEKIAITDIQGCLLTRDLLAKHYIRSWFEEYAKGEHLDHRFIVYSDKIRLLRSLSCW